MVQLWFNIAIGGWMHTCNRWIYNCQYSVIITLYWILVWHLVILPTWTFPITLYWRLLSKTFNIKLDKIKLAMLNWICLPLGSLRGIQLHSFCRPLRKQAGTDRCKRNNHWVEALHQPCLRPLWWTGKQQKEAWAKEDRPSFSLLPVNLARWYVVLTGERACRSNEPDTETSFMSHHA